ncbi:ion transporter [bacterium]|nr:ion transporter [bacterium]
MAFVMVFIGINTALLACDYHNDALCTEMEMTVNKIYPENVPIGLKEGELNGPCMSTDLTDMLELGNIILTIFFAFEMVLKWIALGLMDYFADGFNRFDSFIVATSLFELALAAIDPVPVAHKSGGFITVLRAGRLFRVFKLARAWTALKKVLNTVASSLGSLLPLSIILFLFMFIYSLLGMQLYGGYFFFPGRGECASWERHNNGCSIPRANFDQFITAMVAIFQMMTGEDWNVVMYDGIASSSSGSFFYFMILVVFGNYIILNLFLAILLSGFEGNDGEDSDDEAEEEDNGKNEGGLMKKLCSCCTSSKVTPDDEGGDDKGLEKLHGAEGIMHLAESDRDENTIPDHKAFGLLGKTNCIRKVAFDIAHNSLFENFILTLIIISSVTLGYQNPVKHDGPNKFGTQAMVMYYMDIVFLAIFTVEFLLKHIAFGVVLHPRAYWRDPWNIMDGFIVIVGYIGILAEDLPQLKPLRAIRTMRALRPLRALRRFPGMKLAVNCLLGSIPLMIPMALVSLLFFLIFAILGLQLFSGKFWYCSFDAHADDSAQVENAAKFLALLVGYKGAIVNGGTEYVPVAECHGPVDGAACAWSTELDFTRSSCPDGCVWSQEAANKESEKWLADYVNDLGYSQRDETGDFLDPPEPLKTIAHVTKEFPYMQVTELRNQAFQLLLGTSCGTSCETDKRRVMTQASASADTLVSCPTDCQEAPLTGLPFTTCTGTANTVDGTTPTCDLDAATDGTADCPAGCTAPLTLYAQGSRDPYLWDLATTSVAPTAPGFEEFCTNEGSFHGTQCSRAECRLVGGMWTSAMSHFDNIYESLLCLFEMSTTEGWPAVMWAGVDSINVGQQPRQASTWGGGTIGAMLFFVMFLVVGNFFVLNLFVGAVIDNYLDLEEAAKKDMELMTPEQKEWVETQKKMVGLQLRAKIPEPENGFRKKVYHVVQKTAFEVVVTVLIIVNILILAMKHRAMTSEFEMGFLFYSNWFFTVAFIIEAIMKITAYGPKHYWKDAWNKFDFLLVLVSVLDKILVLDGIGTFFRVFRVARIVRVARSASDLRRMFQTIIISIPALANVGSLLFLLFFIYSILGVNFFP